MVIHQNWLIHQKNLFGLKPTSQQYKIFDKIQKSNKINIIKMCLCIEVKSDFTNTFNTFLAY
jgi:hypothetical protein